MNGPADQRDDMVYGKVLHRRLNMKARGREVFKMDMDRKRMLMEVSHCHILQLYLSDNGMKIRFTVYELHIYFHRRTPVGFSIVFEIK